MVRVEPTGALAKGRLLCDGCGESAVQVVDTGVVDRVTGYRESIAVCVNYPECQHEAEEPGDAFYEGRG
jgi:hypothetical protein